jgi:hypothetical protein
MTLDPNVVQLWKHYEDIAMHFNELIIDYRLQLMGGTGVLGTVAGHLSSNNVDKECRSRFLMSYCSLELLTKDTPREMHSRGARMGRRRRSETHHQPYLQQLRQSRAVAELREGIHRSSLLSATGNASSRFGSEPKLTPRT